MHNLHTPEIMPNVTVRTARPMQNAIIINDQTYIVLYILRSSVLCTQLKLKLKPVFLVQSSPKSK